MEWTGTNRTILILLCVVSYLKNNIDLTRTEGIFHANGEETVERQQNDVRNVIGAVKQRRLSGCGTSHAWMRKFWSENVK
jgi:hypothetical protein